MAYTSGKPNFGEAKQAISALRELDSGLARIASSDESSSAAIKKAAGALLESEVLNTLESLSVDELNRKKIGIRVSAIRAAGYGTIRAIYEAPLQKIINIDGISEDTARLVKLRVKKMADQVRESTALRLSPDKRSPEADALLRELFINRRSGAVRASCRSYYNTTHKQVASALNAASNARSGLSWLLSSKNRKSGAEEALSLIVTYLDGEYGEYASSLIGENRSIEATDIGTVWSDFAINSASYYADLEKAVPELNVISTDSGLPEDMVQQIEAINPDNTGLKCTLRQYQDFGVKYILNGGSVLLGDEMGLGKTVQAISVMVALRNTGKTHFMVVCPAGVLVNWCREIQQHSDLKPVKIHGADRAALNQWLREGGVAVTTYESISKFALPEGFRFAILVADEAHYAKNPEAIRTRALLRMKQCAERALYMTGTPLENNVEEMCFLLGCLRPDIMEKVKDVSYLSSAPQFRSDIAPVYFRRTREDVLKELPDLIESEEWCELNAYEKSVYYRDVLTKQFMAMRQVSWNVPDPKQSTKGARLLELCEMAARENRKVIVFSFFLHTLEKVCELLGDRCVGLITGAVSPKRRQEIIDSFAAADGNAVLAAQIQAGGTGLNIQSASVIILCEPQIKPSIENQAISRAYRMGQVRSVLVYRLLCENTVDERIMQILSDKQEIFDSFAEESVSGDASLNYVPRSTNDIVEEEFKRVQAECSDGAGSAGENTAESPDNYDVSEESKLS